MEQMPDSLVICLRTNDSPVLSDGTFLALLSQCNSPELTGQFVSVGIQVSRLFLCSPWNAVLIHTA
jgi:hypothetical protein